MRTRTLASLRQDVADRADIDLPSDSPATFVTKTTANRWINQSCRRFFGKLVQAYGEDYYSSTASISVVSGTNHYTLPADFYQLDYFRVSIGGVTHTIPRAQKDYIDNDPLLNVGWLPPYGLPTYRLIGNSVYFAPTPLQSATVLMRYIATTFMFAGSTPSPGAAIADLASDDDYVDGVNGWEEWIVLDVAIKALMRSERDSNALRSEQQQIEADMISQSQERTRDAASIRKVYNAGGW